jgi:hypothetical protein
LSELRQLLAARFPPSPRRDDSVVPTGVVGLDEPLSGGLPAGAFTELICAGSAGGGLVLHAALQNTRIARQRVGLIDAADSFSPDEIPAGLLDHLVWARGSEKNGGSELKTIWAVADLLLRDPHFALVVLDLRGVSERELLRTPSATWYRLQHALEASRVAALVFSTTAAVPCAQHRFRLDDTLHAQSWTDERTALSAALRPAHERQRQQTRSLSA